ncbi:MAG: transcriptional regulator [Psychrobacillus psychrodurans]
MRDQLVKAMQHNKIVNMMYLAKFGEITKRRIKIIKISGDTFQAYCFVRRAKRTFLIDNVLAIIPVVKKGREVV